MSPEFLMQLVVGSMVAIIGYFAKKSFARVETKLDGLQTEQAKTDVSVAKLEIRVGHLEDARHSA